MAFDPDAPASEGSGIYGLPYTREDAHVVLLPVPFDATTSYRPGTAEGPDAIRAAADQVELFDLCFGAVHQRGIYMEETDPSIATLSQSMRIAAREEPEPSAKTLALVNDACNSINTHIHEWTTQVLAEGKVPGLVGGEHAISYASIKACAEAHPDLGVLQIDAHMDLRKAYEGFQWSHASVMDNVIRDCPGVSKLIQVGIRDVGTAELKRARASEGRIETHFDHDWAHALNQGTTFSSLCARAIDSLPDHVYITVDIDGLDPSLCPHTGTPVPGGLTFPQATELLLTLARSGRTVVGFDLVEVAPSHDPDAPEWDANVGARLLYRLCGMSPFTPPELE